MFTGPAIYFNFNRKCVLLVADMESGKAEYIEFASRKIQIVAVASEKFHSDYKISTESKPAAELAQSMLKLSSNGVSITPAARFTLEQVLHHPTTSEAPMAVPTTLKTSSKKPAAKAPAPKGTKKLSEMIEEGDKPIFEVKNGKAVAIEPELKGIDAAFDEPKVAHATTEVDTKPSSVAEEAAKIVADAQAEVAKQIAEMKALLEEAKQKAEEKKLLEKARADAKKITDAGKAELEKLKKQMKALAGGKAPRGAKKEKVEGEKKTRTKIDIAGKKIKLIELPVVRGESARGALITAICESKTVEEALDYEGATNSLIMRLVKKGNISLV